MKGNITKRGANSFRLKIELARDPVTGKRRFHWETVSGQTGEPLGAIRRRARARLVELLHEINKGEHVERTTVTVEHYVASWLDAPAGLSPKTVERYRQLAAQQIYPHLGAVELQKLTPAHIQSWHGTLLGRGGLNGRPLSPRTVGHAHRLLGTALARAAQAQLVSRVVTAIVRPPKVEEQEISCLTGDQIGAVLTALRNHCLYPIIVTALGTGLRRGELLALTWGAVDLDGAVLRVEKSLEETRDGLRLKAPKTRNGRRAVSLAPTVVETLRQHRKAQLEQRMALGLGRLPDDAPLFANFDGAPMSPDKLSRDWANLVRLRKLPRVPFHGLRHSHVSALIAGGLDVFAVSRRIGHSDAALTLRTYTHWFSQKDVEATAAIETALTR